MHDEGDVPLAGDEFGQVANTAKIVWEAFDVAATSVSVSALSSTSAGSMSSPSRRNTLPPLANEDLGVSCHGETSGGVG